MLLKPWLLLIKWSIIMIFKGKVLGTILHHLTYHIKINKRFQFQKVTDCSFNITFYLQKMNFKINVKLQYMILAPNLQQVRVCRFWACGLDRFHRNPRTV